MSMSISNRNFQGSTRILDKTRLVRKANSHQWDEDHEFSFFLRAIRTIRCIRDFVASSNAGAYVCSACRENAKISGSQNAPGSVAASIIRRVINARAVACSTVAPRYV